MDEHLQQENFHFHSCMSNTLKFVNVMKLFLKCPVLLMNFFLFLCRSYARRWNDVRFQHVQQPAFTSTASCFGSSRSHRSPDTTRKFGGTLLARRQDSSRLEIPSARTRLPTSCRSDSRRRIRLQEVPDGVSCRSPLPQPPEDDLLSEQTGERNKSHSEACAVPCRV